MPDLDNDNDDLNDDDLDDADLEEEGIFADVHDIFASKANKKEHDDHRNPVLTRAQEEGEMFAVTPDQDDDGNVIATQSPQEKPFPAPPIPQRVPPLKGARPAPARPGPQPVPRAPLQRPIGAVDRHQLVARFDRAGRPLVARFVNGKQQEGFRHPSKQEALAFNKGGKWVRGGPAMGDAAVADTTDPSTDSSAPLTIFGKPVKTVLMWGGGLTLLGLGVWWVWKRNKADKETTVRHVKG